MTCRFKRGAPWVSGPCLAALLAACGDGSHGAPQALAGADAGHDAALEAAPPIDAGIAHDLVDHALWRDADPLKDPLATHQPLPIDCNFAGWGLERGELEIDTGNCNYAYLEQPTLMAVHPGDTLLMELRHFDLTAPEPAEAHVAVLFGDSVSWQTTLEIPHPAEVLRVQWTAERDIPAGQRVAVHLHNHGQNTWTLASLSVRP